MKIKTTQIIFALATAVFAYTSINAQKYVAEFKDNNKLWGYIGSDGKVIIPAQFSSVSPFSPEGIAVVKDPESKVHKYINIKGEEFKPEVEAQDYKEFREGMAPVKIGEKWGCINIQGKLVVPAEYKKVSYYNDGRAWATDLAGKIYLLDKQGKIIDLSKLGISDYQNFSEGLAAVKIGTTWGFIDVNGNLVIENKYMKADYFSAGLTWVRIAEKQMAYINTKGEIVINGDFISCDRFDPVSGMARVKSLSGWHYINKSGNNLSVNTKRFNDFQEGLCRADNNLEVIKVGYIKKDGSWAIEPQFDAASDFSNGIACVRVNDMWGAIDKSGKYIIDPVYSNLEDFYLVK